MMTSMDVDQFFIQQLNNKFINQPILIHSLILADLHDHNPQDFFPEESNACGIKECYVLTPRRRLYGLVCRPDRRAGNGYWENFGYTDSKIIGMDGVVGVKKKLCFYEGELSHGHKTNWKMIEYRLQHHYCSIRCDHRSGRLDDWVLCKVYEDLTPEALSAQIERMNIL
ncbi:hypothetical protein L1049_005217 [Liquidambar formosana]|uniref:NAC domain-containing protein n=1 Tax=Liquidambar formosana TaxID=63359 RepID=A0AAP0RQ96_LIQFO